MKYNSRFALKLTGLIVVIFILQLIFPKITSLFALNSSYVFSRPWTIITSIFLHGSFAHLLLNGFALALFGSILEEIIGTKKFISTFFLSGIIAGITAAPFYNSALGASGAIYGILGILTVLRPGMTVWVSYLPLPMWAAAIFWALQDIFGTFIPSNIANFAHLGGLAAGLLIGFFLRKEKSPLTIKRKKDQLMLTKEELDEWERRNI